MVYFQGHASPGVYARAFLEGRFDHRVESQELPPRTPRYTRPLQLSAPLADEGLLAVSHRQHGHRPAERHLPGPLHALPGKSRPHREDRPQGLGLCRRWRDRRGRYPRRDRPRCTRKARQPHLRHQLQPAAPRRPRARQRPHHRRVGRHLPRRRLERHQGHLGRRTGTSSSRRDHQGLLLKRMEECVDGDFQALQGEGWCLSPRTTSSASTPSYSKIVKEQDRRTSSPTSTAADTTPPRSTTPTSAPLEHKGGPTVILAKTVKGYGLAAAQSRNPTHSEKKLTDEGLAAFVKQLRHSSCPPKALPRTPTSISPEPNPIPPCSICRRVASR